MPNHVTTVCTISGPPADIDRCMSTHFGKTPKGDVFKFETIISKPVCVDETESSSDADDGFFALTGLHETRFGAFCESPMHRAARGQGFPMTALTTVEEYRRWLEEKRPDAIKQGLASLRCFRETGHRNWYDWNIANWGTKWGAYDCEIRESKPGHAVFKFETAWSFPEKIFRKLGELYPAVTFAVVVFDEGWGFACTGEFNGRNDYATVKATKELYERVYGKPYEEDEDEDEDE